MSAPLHHPHRGDLPPLPPPSREAEDQSYGYLKPTIQSEQGDSYEQLDEQNCTPPPVHRVVSLDPHDLSDLPLENAPLPSGKIYFLITRRPILNKLWEIIF